MKKLTFSIFILSFLVSGCASKENQETKRQIISGISITPAAVTTVDEYYETSATVKTLDSSVVTGMIMGKVTSLKVKEGDKVSAGQLLLTIDNRDTAQKVIAAKAGINEAIKTAESAYQNKILTEKTFKRNKNLYKENVITKQEFDQIKAQKNIAESEYQRSLYGIERAKAGLGEVGVYQSYANVVAPVSGVVVERNIDKGSTAVPGHPLLTIEAQNNNEFEANISETYLDKIKAGMTVYLDLENKKIKSKIVSVIPKIDPDTRTFKIKIAISGLKSGQYAKIKIPVAKKQAILVPVEAVVQKGQLIGVYTVDENKIISYRLIRTGKTFGSKLEVLSGLDKGDKVITSGVDKAVDGGEVR